MQIMITYTTEDIYQAQKLKYFSSNLKYLYWFYALASILLVALFKEQMSVVSITFWSIFCVFFLSYPYIFLKYYGKSSLKKRIAVQPVINIEIDESSYRTNSDLAKTEIKWESFSCFKYNERVLLLYVQNKFFSAIPKRAVSDEEWSKLVGFLKGKIKA